jgi:hypothetical protein
MQLHATRQDDPLAHARDIQAWLEAHRRPATASPDEPLPTPPAGPRCADLTQNAPSDAMGAD